MLNRLKYLFLLLFCLSAKMAFAQYPQNQSYPGRQQPANFNRDTASTRQQIMSDDQAIDEQRKKEEGKHDSVTFTSKFIRVANEKLLKDSTVVFPLDTGLNNYENYGPLNQPRDPKISLGNTGLPQRDLLFEPNKTIGFDIGQHFLDPYILTPQDILYYKARVGYTNLTLFNSGTKEQIFKAIHSQNINPQLNVGFNLNFIGSRGFYARQNVGDMNAAFFTWYESKNKRYNLLANYIANTLKTPENGSIVNDSLFPSPPPSSSYTTDQNLPVRLYSAQDNIHNNGLYLKQYYYIGKIDSLKKGAGNSVLPTQRVGYTFYYNSVKSTFFQNEPDNYGVFPDYYYSAKYSRDSLSVFHIQNAFAYSFYLRAKPTGAVKNEVKLDLGLVQDYYQYQQFVTDTGIINTFGRIIQIDRKQNTSFQDLTLQGKDGYRFSDKIFLDLDVQQVAEGRDFGNFLYEGKLTLSGGRKAGRIILDAYSQNSSPPLIYTDWVSNHYIFHNNFDNQKTNSASFTYINDALQLDLKAEYFLISNYLYFAAQPNGIDAAPTQLHSPINLLKLSLGKNLTFGHVHFDNYIVYEKSDFLSTLRVPDVYTYSNLYYSKLLFQVLHSTFGLNVRYNTPYVAPSYAVGIGQFYNNTPGLTFSSYPVGSVYFNATLILTNILLDYDYVNQGLFSNGYYMVNRYPGPNRLLKIGVSWTFYN